MMSEYIEILLKRTLRGIRKSILNGLPPPAVVFLSIPGKVGECAAGTYADMGLGGASGGKHKGGT